MPPPRALGHKQPGAMVSSCAHPMPALPGPPEKSPAPPFDTFEYFQDKEDDLDKPYNDRSYLSSEGLARDDARTGEPPTRVGGSSVGHPPPSAPHHHQLPFPRVCGPADKRPRAMAPHVQCGGQGSLHPAALLPPLLHQLRAVSPAPCLLPRLAQWAPPLEKGGMQWCLCLSFPSDIPPTVPQPCIGRARDLGRGVMRWGSNLGELPGFWHTHSAGQASPLRLQVWSGNKWERLQGSAEDAGASRQSTPWALPAGIAGALPTGFPILTMPSPDAREPLLSLPPSRSSFFCSSSLPGPFA